MVTDLRPMMEINLFIEEDTSQGEGIRAIDRA
jgi:hypothetical protein